MPEYDYYATQVVGPAWREATVLALATADGLDAVYNGAARPWMACFDFNFPEPAPGSTFAGLAVYLVATATCFQSGNREIELALTIDGQLPYDPDPGTFTRVTLPYNGHDIIETSVTVPDAASISPLLILGTGCGVLIRKASTEDGPYVCIDELRAEATWVSGG